MTRIASVLLLTGCVILAPACSAIRDMVGVPWGGSSGGRPGQDCYDQFGRTYCPLVSAEGFVETGIASWYGEDFHGKPTAMGEPYNMYAMTAAHKTLPLPTRVRVTNLENGRSAELRVNDRGPFVGDRVIDLSYNAARELGVYRSGTARVRVEALEAGGSPEPSPAAGAFTYLQTGAFAYRENAAKLYYRIREAGISGVYLRRKGNGVYAVWVGPLDNARHMTRLKRQLANIGISRTVRVQGVAPPG
ncbi:MAG: septal ring lytic transglycosylase RlpA family protein [Gammaproteobacteria bacterium]|nr:septal ring lytic transglycosylase RlpA family protein [Gammaproteobacteria bacterium]